MESPFKKVGRKIEEERRSSEGKDLRKDVSNLPKRGAGAGSGKWDEESLHVVWGYRAKSRTEST